MSARRRRYGSQGRSLTSPALISSTVAWTPRVEVPSSTRPSSAALPPPDPRRVAARRVSGYRKPVVNADHAGLVNRYLNASRERFEDQEEESIEQLVARYRPKSVGIEDACISRRNSLQGTSTPSSPMPITPCLSRNSLTEARLSASDVRIRWQLLSTAETGSGRMPIGSSSSRSGRLARISQSNIRPFGSGANNASANGPGGQPLQAGPEPGSPLKKEFKHRFEIIKKLGSGTYGKVSLAFDHKFEREVAVKLIKKSAIENKADLVRIRREIRIMSSLQTPDKYHPNIIQIFEVFENKDKIILVMEYASGGELYDYVSKFGSLPESEARRIFRQITSAVLYCHKHKVAHRDLKLENILLDQDNNAKIADFGLSNYFSEKTLLTTFCGSPLYASPEIINGTPYRGPEVDCWSLGILLYTLVYGSMPFDGRDFNRMVRQIKRGSYFEPDTPSTASMLIRNMLRVNPDRRADIFEIASHWWLNLEENMPVIQELPENQIFDHTPLTERAETIMVQDLADETDVFMEFGHLSNETRKKIEEFRRRKNAAEEYIDNSPIKPPKTRRTDGQETEEMRSDEKSLRGVEAKKDKDTSDPLERLRQIENRLGKPQPRTGLSNVPQTAPPTKEIPGPFRPPEVKEIAKTETKKTEQPEDPRTARSSQRAPSFVPVHESSPPPPTSRRNSNVMASVNTYRIETDSLNMLMNQVLEQMEKGPVSLNLVSRIKAHPLYDTRPMVKELLESIIAAQPSEVQKQTSKLIVHPNQGHAAKPVSDRRDSASKRERQTMGERPWHSVEVGFDPDEVDAESMKTSSISTATEVTVQDTSFEDSDDQKETTPRLPSESRETQTMAVEESEDDEEYSDSEMEELADDVEKVVDSNKNVPRVKEIESLEAPPPPDPGTSPSPQFLDAFDRGLIKRQSKGKYQHQMVQQYGRGVSTECESPTMTRKLLGGPQPTSEQSPFLFDKAKKLIMAYPVRPDPAELDDLFVKKKKDWLKNVETVLKEDKPPPSPSTVGSVPPRTPPPIDSEEEEEEESEEDEESEEESDVEITRRPRAMVTIGAVRRDGDRIETNVSVVGSNRKTAYMQSAPASIHASMSPEPSKPSTNAKYLVTVAELKTKPSTVVNSSNEPKSYNRITLGGGNVDNTKSTIEKKIAERESQLKEELAEHARPYHYTNPMFVANRGYSRIVEKDEGKESWESTAAYIRRKNRERRFRNRTIGDPEEVIRATMGMDLKANGSDSHALGRMSPADPFYSHHSGTSNLLSYVRPRFHEDSYRRRDLDERPLSPVSRINTAAVVREERGKSFSIHDASPDRPDYRSGAYAVGDTRSYYTNSSPGYTRKFEHEIGSGLPSSSLHSWATEPRKFEVYKTRAERDREMNTLHTTPTAPSSYRSSAYTSSTSDRPLTYGYRSNEASYRTAGSDNYGYRKTTDIERSVTPGLDHVLLNPSGPSIETSAARGAARRVQSALTESDRRNYARSRSIDRKQSRGEHDYGAPIRSRLMTPDSSGTDYTYVNYHDSSNGRTSQSRDEKGQPRSILKNKQTAEIEPRAELSGNGQGQVGGAPTRLSVLDRLRRHLSLEKEKTPPRETTIQRGLSGVGSPKDSVGLSGSEDTPKRKRSLLGFNRRKTSEVRLGSDGKLITNGYEDYKRPSSPIDKIKSLFRRESATRDTSNINNNDFYTSRYTSALDKSYPTSNVARDAYIPQYRKYPGSTPRDTDRSLNRYSYTSGLTDQRRTWYDDHNH